MELKKCPNPWGNYIGFNDDPLDMFGKIMSISDTLMWEYYTLLTDISINELNNKKEAVNKNELHPKEAKSLLAKLIMDQFHPEEKNKEAIEEWNKIHNTKNRSIPDNLETLILDESYFTDSNPMLLGTLTKNGFFSSVSEGRRLVQNGGLYLNEEKVSDEKLSLEKGKEYIVRQGKKGKFIKIIT
jgi:tyrosyl-tRNA synthetase